MNAKLKKVFFALLLIAAILPVGAVTALSTTSHSHGKDFQHSSHKDCPVYQASLMGFVMSGIVFGFAAVFFRPIFTGLKERPLILKNAPALCRRLRAPPQAHQA